MRWKKRIRWPLAATVLGALAALAAAQEHGVMKERGATHEPGGPRPGCLQISGSRLVAEELARLDPRFLAYPPDTDFGYPPAPGEKRTIALSNGHTACIERASRLLKEGEIRTALELNDRAVTATVLDFPRQAFPAGTLRFPLDGAAPPVRGEDTVLWRGSIEYEPGRTAALWARVRLRRETKCLRALRALEKGEELSPEIFGSADCDAAAILAGALDPASPALALGERGRVTTRRVRKGEWLTAEMFSEAAMVVARRQAVLEVQSGGARLRFPVTPEESGTEGMAVWVRSTLTRERLQARVAGVDHLVLTLPGAENASAARRVVSGNRPAGVAP